MSTQERFRDNRSIGLSDSIMVRRQHTKRNESSSHELG